MQQTVSTVPCLEHIRYRLSTMNRAGEVGKDTTLNKNAVIMEYLCDTFSHISGLHIPDHVFHIPVFFRMIKNIVDDCLWGGLPVIIEIGCKDKIYREPKPFSSGHLLPEYHDYTLPED